MPIGQGFTKPFIIAFDDTNKTPSCKSSKELTIRLHINQLFSFAISLTWDSFGGLLPVLHTKVSQIPPLLINETEKSRYYIFY